MSVHDLRGRALSDLRISVTDRCNLRCTYCMPRDSFGPDHAFLPRSGLLTFEEIRDVVAAVGGLGLKKIRLTGGEPLVRRDLDRLTRMLRVALPEADIALTTNGILLATYAMTLAEAGLNRVTVSLDALDAEVYAAMADVDHGPEAALEGIEAALDAGLRVKVNCVVRAGVNERELLPLLRNFGPRGITVRFIEYMDVGATNDWSMTSVLPGSDVRALVEEAHGPLEAIAPLISSDVARTWRTKEGWVFGCIDSVTAPFCGDCSRARLSADGSLYTCLFSNQGHPLLPLLRGGASSDEVRQALVSIWSGRKDAYSEQRSATGERSGRVEMSYIGG
jgi:cyclic pyranopterin phosphate synthase